MNNKSIKEFLEKSPLSSMKKIETKSKKNKDKSKRKRNKVQ